MAHPLVNTINLMLEKFLNKMTAKNVSENIKLDFKSMKTFNASTSILKKFCNNSRVSFHRSPVSNIFQNSVIIFADREFYNRLLQSCVVNSCFVFALTA
ncbi:hypothetical protein WN51_06580 [Melipona quadrifasciata]|uniref:Menorin-like domain-containing protein n=1 Tax=Melipona quadrifasciata TaxID=166423 RepID=A0A0M8ZT81_9HYME|nr:hypothetical protein WN51_06580 [Melipona quadrifasciata]